MKKVLFIAAFLALLFPSVLSASIEKEASEPQTAQVIAAKADIFLEASQHSIVIDTIPRGTTVTLFPSGKKDKKWLYISYLSQKRGSQVTGFVDSQRVEIVKENSDPEEKKTQEVEGEPEELSDLLKTMQQEKNQEEVDEKQDEVEQPEHSVEEVKTLNEQTESQQEKNAGISDKEEKEKMEQLETDSEKTEGDGLAPLAQENPLADEEAPDEQAGETDVEELPKVITKVAVKVPRANIRLMPTTKSPIIHQVYSGVELKHVAKIANWHRVNLAPNIEGIVLSGYIHNNIVDEILEAVVPPEPTPEDLPEKETEVAEEVTKFEPESESVQEVPVLRKSSIGKYYWVGGGAGYTMPSQSYFGKGLNFSGTFGIGVMKHLAIELRVPYFQSDVSGTEGGLSSGRLSNLSLMLSVQGRYPIKNRYVPYLVAGGDYHLNKFSLNEEITRAWNDLGFSVQESVDHTFGFHFGVGLDFFLLQNIVLNVDARYYTANLTGSRTLAHQISQETSTGAINSMKLNSLQAGISVKLFLDPLKKK